MINVCKIFSLAWIYQSFHYQPLVRKSTCTGKWNIYTRIFDADCMGRQIFSRITSQLICYLYVICSLIKFKLDK